MLFFKFSSFSPIVVIVFQVESLMRGRQAFKRIYDPLRSTHFSFETSHFIIGIITDK